MLAYSFWQATITAALTAACFALVAKMKGRRWFPPLPEADPDDPETRRDKLAYYGANALALLVGAAAGVSLLLLTPPPDGPMRFSPFDRGGRYIGPVFVLLGIGGAVVPWIVRRMVRPGPLLHILHRTCRQYGGVDVGPILVRFGCVVATIAVVLHVSLKEIHVTLEEQQVRWRDWPWQDEQQRDWSQVDDIRIVRTFEAMTGTVVERPHLVLRFADGVEVVTGKSDTRPDGFWEGPARYASEHSGVPVRHVVR